MPAPLHGTFGPLQVSRDQFLTAAENGRLLTAITTTMSLLTALR